MRPVRRTAWLAVVASVAALGVAACSGDTEGQDAFCDAAAETESFEEVFASFDPDDVPAATETFTEARDVEIRLRRHAPDAIRADLDLLVQFFDDLVEGLEKVDPESAERPAIYDEVGTQIDKIEAASDRIATYVETNCPPAPDG